MRRAGGLGCAMWMALLCAASAPARAEPPGDGSDLLPAVVDEIHVEGLWRTRKATVLAELPFREGEAVRPEQWEQAIVRLWSVRLFSGVDARLEENDGAVVARFRLEERLSVNPNFRFASGGGQWWLRTGLHDWNLLGRFIDVTLQYERFGPYNGGHLAVFHPRLLGRSLQGLLVAEHLYRPRPAFTHARTRGRLEALHERHDRLRFGLALDLVSDRFLAGEPGEALPVASEGVLTTLSVRSGLVELDRLHSRGATLEARATLAGTTDPSSRTFAQLWMEALAFRRLGNRWNLALRLQAGAMSASSPQHHFFLGGLDLVRGYADSLVRTRLFALANLEARVAVWELGPFALMPAAFLDGALAAGDTEGPPRLLSTGAGLRVLVPRMVNTGLRVDYAVPLLARAKPNLSIGAFQFF